jgi:hypothetical protein
MKFFLLCPIPENQKPINEYLSLKEEFFTQFLLRKEKDFFSIYSNLKYKIFPFFVFFLFCNFWFFNYQNFLVDFFLFKLLKLFIQSILFTNFLLLIFVCISYIRWSQLEIRLNEARLFYEEGSWYDGQRWEKPFLLIKNDRLLTTQKIQPLLQKYFFFFRGLFYFQLVLLFSFFITDQLMTSLLSNSL